MYKTAALGVIYGWENWPIRVEGTHRLSDFDHRYLRSTARVWWEYLVSNDEVRYQVLGADSRPPTTIIALHLILWLGQL